MFLKVLPPFLSLNEPRLSPFLNTWGSLLSSTRNQTPMIQNFLLITLETPSTYYRCNEVGRARASIALVTRWHDQSVRSMCSVE